MSTQPNPPHSEEYLPGTTITETEYKAFLRRWGWREDLPEEEKRSLEAELTVADADMAINLGF